MSLIQEALEKASKVQAPENFFEIPKRAPVQAPASVQKTAAKITPPKITKSVLSYAAGFKPANIQLSPQFLIRAGVAIALISVLGIWAFFLGRAGKSSVMLAGVPSAASKSSILPGTSAGAVKFVLTGITDSEDGKLALINNQVVGVGDRLQEKAFVKEIQTRSVTLDYNHKEVKLFL